MITRLRQKILLILGLCALLCPNISFAGPFSSVAGCLTNPCSCGHGDHNRTWGGSTLSHTHNANCAPWNTVDGKNGCLKQFRLPYIMEINYLKFCAEDSGSQDFFNPDIRVRIQTCNVGCWAFSTRLDGDGECQIYPGPYGLPTVRLCARATFPKFIEHVTPVNPYETPAARAAWDAISSAAVAVGIRRETTFGYTYGWHLDNEGYPTADQIFTDDDGNEVVLNFPKTCAYWDPYIGDKFGHLFGFFVNGISQMVTGVDVTVGNAGITEAHMQKFKDAAAVTATEAASLTRVRVAQSYFQLDVFDLNPVYQPVHYAEGGTHFLFRMIIAMFRMGLSLDQMRNQLIMMASNSMDMPEVMISGISGLLDFMAVGGIGFGPNPLMMQTLEYFGQLNNVVGASLGCVDVPLGPYPPPYCPTLTAAPPVPVLTKICPTEIVGGTATEATATPSSRCVKSSVQNNAVHNAVRVSFSNSLPVCTGPRTPNMGLCVRIPLSQTGSTVNYATSALAMNTLTSGLNTLRKCSTIPALAAEMPCVEVADSRCTGTNRYCPTNLRILYSDREATSATQEYYPGVVDCTPSATGSSCQKIWGVDIGDYRDIAINFPTTETSYNTSALTASTNIVDPSNTSMAVTAKIYRAPTTHATGVSMSNSSIYAFDAANTLLGSVTRAEMPMPTVMSCNPPAPGAIATCSTSHVRPALIAKVGIGSSTTEGAVSLDTYYSGSGGVSTETLNLAGYDYRTFATDNSLITAPFLGPRSINGSSIYGSSYINGPPYNSGGTVNSGARYRDGLEYINGQYIYGGNYLCLKDYEFERCGVSASDMNCVKTNMTNTSLINCRDFQTRVASNSSYTGISLCNAQQRSSYSLTRNETFTGPNITVGIYNSGTQYCYDYSSSGANGPLCAAGRTRSLRVDPASSITGALTSSQFYNYNPSSPPTPPETVRDKTPMEHGLCVPIPAMPRCGATSASAASSNGNATWAAANIGVNSVGTCSPGYMRKSPSSLSRLCVRNNTNGSAQLQALTSSMGCDSACYITTTGFPNKSYNNTTKLVTLTSGGHDSIGHGGWYDYSARINVPQNTRELKLRTVGVDDGVSITVNGNNVGTVPSSGVPTSDTSTRNVRHFNLDLLPYVGANRQLNIQFRVRVFDKGRFDAQIKYDLPGCSNFVFR